ncbi:DUF2946 family protein [Rhodoferax fermentans]|uniref:DUF2946 domain-containing protein n=1 Tax=Rhodoferax fermentans TaxID=28066 RepID=A0A1T1ARV0_RHOFE|nr:DUF2946 family protein [Rhodoferax fermentans]MBK1683200.1 DUF2946 domain-containing protein [Rhodoferax fermentans]OOV06723.1 hypothetical protein RF819_08290 [Rhodoferax fermentans]
MFAVPSPLLIALRRPRVVWLALWIALLGALVPTLSHALVWARGDAALVEICTTTGQRWVVLEQAQADGALRTADTSGDPASAQGLMKHCPFCLLSAERLSTPPPLPFVPLVLAGQAVPAQSRQLFASLLSFVVTPPPRGPPAFLNIQFHSA